MILCDLNKRLWFQITTYKEYFHSFKLMSLYCRWSSGLHPATQLAYTWAARLLVIPATRLAYVRNNHMEICIK